MDTITALLLLLAAGCGAAGALLSTAGRRTALLRRAERAEAGLAAERRLSTETLSLVERSEARLEQSFAALSTTALERAGSSFLDLASATLGRHTAEARGDLESRRSAVDALVTPLRESLAKVEGQLQSLEVARTSAYSGLMEQVRALADGQERLRGETSGLVTALRAPAVRGRWGEMQLRRVVEMAGMVEHCDFVEQASVDGDAGRLRPDLVIRLPGGGSVVVDSKVPLSAFLEAAEARDDIARRASLVAHGRQLRTHVEALSRKAYWQQFQPAPELVVLFVPGEPILSAALEAAPDLYEQAMASSVLLATPTSLIGLLRTIGYGWRQEALADGAREICGLGRQLHGRLGTLVGHVDKLGRSLDSAVGAYNETVGTLESRVLVSARRLGDLGLGSSDLGEDELAAPRHIDRSARVVRAVDIPTELPRLLSG